MPEIGVALWFGMATPWSAAPGRRAPRRDLNGKSCQASAKSLLFSLPFGQVKFPLECLPVVFDRHLKPRSHSSEKLPTILDRADRGQLFLRFRDRAESCAGAYSAGTP